MKIGNINVRLYKALVSKNVVRDDEDLYQEVTGFVVPLSIVLKDGEDTPQFQFGFATLELDFDKIRFSGFGMMCADPHIYKDFKLLGAVDDEGESAYDSCLKEEIEKLKQSDRSKEDCTIQQHDEIHSLRNELKQVRAENEDMYGELMSYKAYIDNHEEIWKSNAEAENKRFVDNMKNVLEIEKEQIRKDTAKEIWQSLYNECCRNPNLYNITLNRNDIIIQARCHGVEVDDE